MALLYTQEAQRKHFLYSLCRRSQKSIVIWCFGDVESAVHSLIETHKHGYTLRTDDRDITECNKFPNWLVLDFPTLIIAYNERF